MNPVRVMMVDVAQRRYRLRTLVPGQVQHDARDDYTLLGGEALCQFILREDPGSLVIARGPLPFLAGNKTTVGYISPLTGLPHYSFVGGRGFAALFNLGLDALVLTSLAAEGDDPPLDNYLVIGGRAPHLDVTWKPVADLPTGQRSAFYWLLERELGGRRENGSIFTLGEAVRGDTRNCGYRTANLAVDGIYHAGRGGAGHVFARYAAALVLLGEPVALDVWFGARADAYRDLRNDEIRSRIETYCARLSRRDGGTVTKLYATGSGDDPTLPARNAQRLGYALADLGARKVLKASRVGQTGCHWCQVNCRHWHWVDVDYAPDGRDMYLDDFEPTYALFSMLDLRPQDNSLKARLQLLDDVDRHLVVPIEQMGSDIIDVGLALAALFEGLSKRLIPVEDVPDFLCEGPYLGSLSVAARVLAELRSGTDAPALRAAANGPQALAEAYPALRDVVFTSGKHTLGNAGHANALWTFLMPFSRYFSHYSGQIYKVPGELIPDLDAAGIAALFERVVAEMLRREMFGILGNALSLCAFTHVIFSEDGRGIALDRSDLLVRSLALYDIDVRREDLEWFAEAFWAQSIALKMAHGWRPPQATDLPTRVFETLTSRLGRSVDDLRVLMGQLIAEWQRQAEVLLYKYGYDVSWGR